MNVDSLTLITNIPDGSRLDSYVWLHQVGDVPTAHTKSVLKKVKIYFSEKRIKWYCLYKQTIDTLTGEISVSVVEKNAHEDIPPLEINEQAKVANKVPIKFMKEVPGFDL